MKDTEKLPEIPEPNTPEVNPNIPPEPVIQPGYPEIKPEEEPVPVKPQPEIAPPGK